MTWIMESFARTSAAALPAKRSVLSESEIRPMAQTYTWVLQGLRDCRLSVLGRQDWAVSVVEHLCCSGPKQHSPESAGVRRHDDEIESACPGNLRNLFRRFPRAQYSGTFGRWKLRLQKRIEFLPGNAPVLFGDLRGRSRGTGR